MNRLLTALLLMCLFSACTTKKKIYQRENKQIEKTANRKSEGKYTTYTTVAYIDKFKNIAITEMNKNGIPASITLAQALLESGTGNSDLAKYANNHFGIKCTSDWTGKGYYKDDDQKDDCFRVYNNPEESFKDHSEFLKRTRYAALFELDKDDFEGWAIGLKAAGYATNPKYPDLLIGIIGKYDLHQYDKREGEIEKIKREDRVLNDINHKDQSKNTFPLTNGNKYTVQQGDTLYNISKRFRLTVEELKALNSLTHNGIKIGQELTIKK